MAVEATNTINGLVLTNPAVLDPVNAGPSHFWLLKSVLKHIFPGSTGSGFNTPITAVEADLNWTKDANTITPPFDVANTALALINHIFTRLLTIEGNIYDYNFYMPHIYPVGSIYINGAVATNPGTLLGFGTWVAVGTGRVLVGVDVSNPITSTVGAIGGSTDAVLPAHTHTATSDTAAAHQHYLSGACQITPAALAGTVAAYGPATTGMTTDAGGAHSHTITVSSTGVSASNANIPPFLTVYMWKRTA